MKKLLILFILFTVYGAHAQPPTFNQVHNAQAIDWVKGVKYLGIPFGSSPTLNGTITTDPGALYFNILDSSVYAYTGTQFLKITGSGAVGDGNNYVSGASFSAGTLTLLRSGLSALTVTGWDIRYLRFTDTTSLIPTKAFLGINNYTKTQEDAKFVPLTRTLTINGVTKTLAQNDSFTVSTLEVDPFRVTNVQFTGNDSIHTLAITTADGITRYSSFFDRGSGGGGGGGSFDTTTIYANLALKKNKSDSTTYGGYYPWSNPLGFLVTETDPVFTASDAFAITSADISNWNNAYSWGNHAGLYVLLSDSSSMLSPYFREVGYALSKSGHIVSFDSLSAAVGFHTRPYNDLRYYSISNPSGFISGNQSITISGDGSGTGTTAITFTLATVNSNVGTFNNVTVNGKGLVTAASNVAYLTSFTEADPLSWHLTGTSTLTGNVTISGSGFYTAMSGGRFEEGKGANINAANNLTLGGDGNTFTITGSTQINAITTANWQSGSKISLIFTGSPTIKHNTAGGAGTGVILLSGSVDYTAAADDVLELVYDGTSWHETTRKVVAAGGGKGVNSLAAVGSSPNANGGSISGNTLTLQPANTSFPGVLLAADWNTFNGKQTALSGTGYLKFSGTTPSYLTPTQVTADLNIFTTSLKGLVPSPTTSTGKFLKDDGTWATTTTGTVTDFSAGDLSPLFTTSEATTTTTPALTFTLSSASAYTVFGRGSGSGAPSYLASLDSNWIPALHSQTYYDLRYLQSFTETDPLSIHLTGTSTQTGDITIAGANKEFNILNGSYFHWTSALDSFELPAVQAHMEFSSRDMQIYMQASNGSAGSRFWADYNSSGRNIVQMESWYDPGGDLSKTEMRSTQGGSHDGYWMSQQTAGNFYFKNMVNITATSRLLGQESSAGGFGNKTGYITMGYGESLGSGALSVDTTLISSRLWRQKGIDSVAALIRGPGTYIVAASNSPSVLKARADYICDGTADESEIETALALGNVQLVQGTYNISSQIDIPSNRTLKGTGKQTILLQSGLTSGFTSHTTGNTIISNSGTQNITVENLTVDGYVNGTSDASYGMYFESVGLGGGDTATLGITVRGVYFKNLSKTGVQLSNCWNNIISGNNFLHVYQDGITLTRTSGVNRTTHTLVSNNIVNGGFAAVFGTYADATTVTNNIFKGQVDETIQFENSDGLLVSNNWGVGDGTGNSNVLNLSTVTGAQITNNYFSKSGGDHLAVATDCIGIIISGNTFREGAKHGLSLDGCTYSTVTSNLFENNSNSSNNFYDGLLLSNCDYSTVTGNTARKGSNTNKQKYGIELFSNNAYVLLNGNNLYTAGVTGDLGDASTTTRQRNNLSLAGEWLDARQDTMWRTPGVDSIKFTINGRLWAIKDSSGGTYTASNGIKLSTADFQWGGTTSGGSDADLSRDTYIDVNGHALQFINSGAGTTLDLWASTSAYVLNINSTSGISVTSSQAGISVQSTGSYAALSAVSTGSANPGDFLKLTSTTNAVQNVLQLITAMSSGTAANGIGTSIEMMAETTTGSSDASNIIISKWSNATYDSRTSQFIVKGVNATVTADLFTINGDGSLKFNNYGVNTFAGTAAYSLGVDASGNVVEFTGGVGGGEANTASNLGGGLANYSTKVGVDLRFNSFDAADFDLASNLITIDATKWLTISGAAAAYQPLDADLTTIAGLTATTDNFIVGVASAWASRTPAQVRTTLGLVIGTNVQAFDADLTTWAGLTPATWAQNLITTANPSAVRYIQINADNSITLNSAASHLTALGGLSSSTAASTYVPQTTTVAGFALSGNITLGTLTIGSHLTGTSYNGSAGVTIATDGTTTATASVLVLRDANANITANNWLGGYSTTVTAATTTTLTVGSTYLQFFTGTTTQTVTLPVASGLTLGHQFEVVNNSTGAVTVNSSGGNPVQVMAAGTAATYTCILTSGTTAASWSVTYTTSVAAAGTLTGTTLNSTVVTSSLTSVGTLTSLTMGGTLAMGANSITITGSIGATGARVAKLWATDIESTNMPTVGGTSLSSTFAPLASPTFTGTVTLPASTSFTTPVLGAATATSLTLSSFLNEKQGADIASATTTDIGAATGNYVNVTGTTTITGLGTVQAGTRRIVQFSGALILTHNATSLILPGAANITTVAGDVATFVSLGAGNWKCTDYLKATRTGTGSAVFATSPALVTPDLGTPSALVLTNATGTLGASATWNGAVISSTYGGTGVNNGARTLTLNTNNIIFASSNQANTVTFANNFTTAGNFALTLTTTGTTNVTLPTTGTLATVSGALGTPTSIVLTNATGLPSLNKSISLAAPTSSETIDFFYTAAAITVTEVREVLRGSSPSVTYTINYGSSPTSATNTIVASHAATSTSGVAATLNITSIPAGSYIWITTSATSGTVNNFHFTMTYTQ